MALPAALDWLKEGKKMSEEWGSFNPLSYDQLFQFVMNQVGHEQLKQIFSFQIGGSKHFSSPVSQKWGGFIWRCST